MTSTWRSSTRCCSSPPSWRSSAAASGGSARPWFWPRCARRTPASRSRGAPLLRAVEGGFILSSAGAPSTTAPIRSYGPLILRFLFYATLLGLRRLAFGGSTARPRWALALPCGALLVQLGTSRAFKQLSPAAFRPNPRGGAARALIAGVPSGAQVSAQVDLVSHLPVASQR